ASAFIGKDGAYVLSASSYLSFVRAGNIAKLKTTDLAQPLMDTETAQVLPPNSSTSVAAYGYIFWQDPPPLYTLYSDSRELLGRRVQPTPEGGPSSMGSAATQDNNLDLR